jgi:hypothetical protein
VALGPRFRGDERIRSSPTWWPASMPAFLSWETNMAYPSTHKLTVIHLSAHSPSIGASPVAAYLRVPFRCSIEKLTAVANGSITTADCSIAVALNGAAISGSPFTLPVAGAGAGQVASMTPTAKTYANEDDAISFTPSGASGANVAGNFTAVFKQA